MAECLTSGRAVKPGCLACGPVGGLTARPEVKGGLAIGLPRCPGCGRAMFRSRGRRRTVVEPGGALATTVSKPPQRRHLLHHERVLRNCLREFRNPLWIAGF